MASNKKNKKGKGQPVKMTPEKYIMERARKLPIGKCYINPEWKEVAWPPSLSPERGQMENSLWEFSLLIRTVLV